MWGLPLLLVDGVFVALPLAVAVFAAVLLELLSLLVWGGGFGGFGGFGAPSSWAVRAVLAWAVSGLSVLLPALVFVDVLLALLLLWVVVLAGGAACFFLLLSVLFLFFAFILLLVME